MEKQGGIETRRNESYGWKMTGYTRAHRDRFNHPLFASQKFCRGYAWDWMVSQAAFKPHSIEIKGSLVALERGQFSHSMRHMAGVFGWSLGVVQRFIDRLKTEHMIDTAIDSGQMVITICNYNKYQADQLQVKSSNDTLNDTEAIQKRYSGDTIKKEGKKEKKVKDSKLAKARMIGDWDPSKENIAYAIEKGIHESMVDTLAEEFRIYWLGRTDRDGSKTEDGWRMTWQGNVRRCATRPEYSKQLNGGYNDNGNHHNGTPKGGKRPDPALEQIARLAGIGRA